MIRKSTGAPGRRWACPWPRRAGSWGRILGTLALAPARQFPRSRLHFGLEETYAADAVSVQRQVSLRRTGLDGNRRRATVSDGATGECRRYGPRPISHIHDHGRGRPGFLAVRCGEAGAIEAKTIADAPANWLSRITFRTALPSAIPPGKTKVDLAGRNIHESGTGLGTGSVADDDARAARRAGCGSESRAIDGGDRSLRQRYVALLRGRADLRAVSRSRYKTYIAPTKRLTYRGLGTMSGFWLVRNRQIVKVSHSKPAKDGGFLHPPGPAVPNFFMTREVIGRC